MKKNVSTLFVLMISLFVLCSTSHGDEILIGADRWCPINCEPESDEPGVMVEIAQQVFSKAGHQVTYKVMPWARAVKLTRQGKVTAVIGAFKGDAPDFIFPENELARLSSSALFTTRSMIWHYEGIASLDAMKLGAILDYDYGDALNAYIEKHRESGQVELLAGEDPLVRNIKKLLANRISVLVEVESVFLYTAKKMGVADQVKKAGQIAPSEPCYIAFSPALEASKAYAEILSDGVAALRQSGELAKILDKYGLEDWK